jgi:hypothetical protein
VRDSGDFVVPLDVKALAAGITVRPEEIRVLVQVPPPTRVSRDSSRMTTLQRR